jgi:hypothetical protein
MTSLFSACCLGNMHFPEVPALATGTCSLHLKLQFCLYPSMLFLHEWTTWTRAVDSMAHRKISVAFIAFPVFSFAWPGCVYTHIWLHRGCVWATFATKLYCKWNIFTQTRSSAKCWLGIYHWSASLAMTGWMHDIGQNVLPTINCWPKWTNKNQMSIPFQV